MKLSTSLAIIQRKNRHISFVDEFQNELLKISEAYADTMISKVGIDDSAFAKVIKNSITETVKLKAQLEGVNSAFDSLQNNYSTLNDTMLLTMKTDI